MRLAEGHVMSDTAIVPRKPRDRPPGRRPLLDEQVADQLLGKAAAEGVELLGPDGLLSQVTKAVLERALAEEMTGASVMSDFVREKWPRMFACAWIGPARFPGPRGAGEDKLHHLRRSAAWGRSTCLPRSLREPSRTAQTRTKETPCRSAFRANQPNTGRPAIACSSARSSSGARWRRWPSPGARYRPGEPCPRTTSLRPPLQTAKPSKCASRSSSRLARIRSLSTTSCSRRATGGRVRGQPAVKRHCCRWRRARTRPPVALREHEVVDNERGWRHLRLLSSA